MKKYKKKLFFVFVFLIMVTSCQKKEHTIYGFSMDAPYSIKIKSYNKENADKAEEYLKKCNDLFDAYDDNSLISTLNREKKLAYSENTVELFDVIKKTLPYCNDKFDISIRNLTELWDFNSDNPVVPSKKDIKEALKTLGSENIIINDNEIILKNNAKIELGAVCKGYVADKMFELLKDDGAIIDIGGTVISSSKDNIKAGIRNPMGEGTLCTFSLGYSQAVSTSGSYERYFYKDGKKYHHILDLKTGTSIDNGLISVTVVSDSALKSDVLSTMCFSEGIDEKKVFDKDVAVIYVTEDKKVYIKGNIEISDLNSDYTLED